eukprot:gene13560-13686_t
MSALHARFHYLQQQQQQKHVSHGQQQCSLFEGDISDLAAVKSKSNLGHVDGDVASALSLADALLRDVEGWEGEVELVPVAAELNRLQELSLNVAKQLAEKRAANKQHLQAVQDAILYELQSQGVSVVLIKPGPVNTAIWSDDADRHLKLLERLTPDQLEVYGRELKLIDVKAEVQPTTGL